jgi:hypothetical protein
MATTSFKRKKYGMVKPIKERKKIIPKPDVRQLARYYKAVASQGIWSKIDNVCYAMDWWAKWVIWFDSKYKRDQLTTTQARKLTQALQFRSHAVAAKQDGEKIAAYTNSITNFEALAKLIDFKVPLFAKYVEEGEKNAKKHKTILGKLADNKSYDRITSLLAKMFRSCPLQLVVVPQITDPVKGLDIGRKIDHTKNTFFYSRKQIKAMRVLLRKEGVLSLALSEAWWLARAMAMPRNKMLIPDKAIQLDAYTTLLDDFYKWASSKEAPSKLVRRPTTKKKKITANMDDNQIEEVFINNMIAEDNEMVEIEP